MKQAAFLALLVASPLCGAEKSGLGKILLNEDGDFTFVGETVPEWRSNLRTMLRSLGDLPVETLVYSLATGSDVLLYPSGAGSSWGWKPVEFPPKSRRLARFGEAVQAGNDGVRWAAEEAANLGRGFVPAFRVNDAHYTSGNTPYLEGEFWSKNRDKFTFKSPPYPVEGLRSYKELLDFSHPEVRQHRLAVIREAISRYQDAMDGFLLDFLRTPAFFPRDEATEKKGLMTDFVAVVRQELDAAEKATGRKIPLLVRVPATLRNCEAIGLDVPAWVDKKIIDALIPAQAMTLAQDSAVGEFLDLASPHDIKVYVSLCNRTAYGYAFTRTAPQTEDYAGRAVGPALLRGAALNYEALGVDGFELYNFNLPVGAASAQGIRSLSDPANATQHARTYAITPAYFFDHLDIYEPPKQVPARVEGPVSLRIYIGENPADILPESYVALRLGFEEPSIPEELKIALNGVVLHPESRSTPKARKGPKSYLQMPVGDPCKMLKRGWNEVTLERTKGPACVVSEVQLGILPPPASA